MVLILEDEMTCSSIYQRLLLNMNKSWEVSCFEDARKALYFLEAQFSQQSKGPSGILLDLHMPHMDGWQFLDIISMIPEIQSNPPLIWLCTADSSSYVFKKCLKNDLIDRILIKPIYSKDLDDFSDKVVEHRLLQKID